MKSFGNVFLVTLAVVLPYGIILYYANEDNKICDTRVKMKDGTTYDCAETRSFDDNLTYITGCDGTKIKVPTVDIKTIEDIKTK
jgi:hypothetical protein